MRNFEHCVFPTSIEILKNAVKNRGKFRQIPIFGFLYRILDIVPGCFL